MVDGYRAALDAALERAVTHGERFVAGGVSLGAHVAATWAAQRRHDAGEHLAGLLLALPAWSGPAAGAPAAQAARATADLVRAGGVEAALAAARTGSPPWLAAELSRAWPGYGSGLAAALDAAAAEPGPRPAALASLAVPTGLAALVDDPVHPLAEARHWLSLLPRAVLHTATLAAFGADPEVLGRATVLGWLQAGQLRDGPPPGRHSGR
ncbi:alpha/beta hydrolase [Pseudonocardia sp. GCM10023141]|uniref:alpha/beta hydrolase n=1 Tax=Pseudonocardia sp. GCM10023141 TaxID=3252653 RepID=UPI003610598E